jgi:hypothetical protein
MFIEMHGMHRFKDDLEWSLILFQMRAGTLTDSDRATINARVVVSEKDKAALLDRKVSMPHTLTLTATLSTLASSSPI